MIVREENLMAHGSLDGHERDNRYCIRGAAVGIFDDGNNGERAGNRDLPGSPARLVPHSANNRPVDGG